MKEIVYGKESKQEVIDRGVYRDRRYLILNRGFEPCAYVEFNNEFEEGNAEGDNCPSHCSLYTTDVIYLGRERFPAIMWDYGQPGDWNGTRSDSENRKMGNKKWTAEEIMVDIVKVIDYLDLLEKEKEAKNE